MAIQLIRKKNIVFFVWLLALYSALLSCNKQNELIENSMRAPEIENLGIEISNNFSRPFVFTNKEAAFFYGEAADLRRDGHQGFYVNALRFLDDYIMQADERYLDRRTSDKITVYPDRIERVFPGQIMENTYLIDNYNCLVVELRSDQIHAFEFIPLLPLSLDVPDMTIKWLKGDNLLLLISSNSEELQGDVGTVGIKFECETQYHSEINDSLASPLPSAKIGKFSFQTNHCRIYFIVGKSEGDVKKLSRTIPKNIGKLVNKKTQRLSRLLATNKVTTNLKDFNQAFQWALISMDQLIMRQTGAGKNVTGIFAGLPWFNNYWGRDTFISFPGAVLVTGRIEEAKEILLSFAQFQNSDSTDSNFGRIPNQVTTDNIIYNTADGTPWFVRELWEHYLYSGDLELLKSLYNVVKLSIKGTLKYHVDENHFLVHEDADTWMDAKGINGPWSPRGNRAVDIQALWFQQLNAGINIAECVGDSIASQEWRKIAAELKKNFPNTYWNKKRRTLYDHINSDNLPDEKIRPNQIFAITIPEAPLLSPEQELAVLREVVTRLTYPYGVASLWQHDTDFHPYHILPASYPKDEAYHNGTVWGWLAGPVVSGLLKFGYNNLGFELLYNESYQIVNWGAAGSLSELFNAIPPKGWDIPEPSGTVSQAWSLAEYIRNVYQDLIGIHPNVPEKTIRISPRLPDAIESLNCKIPIPGNDIDLTIEQSLTACSYKLNYTKGQHPWKIIIDHPVSANKKMTFQHNLAMNDSLIAKIPLVRPNELTLNGLEVEVNFNKIALADSLISYLSFAVPQIDKNLNYLKPPPYPLLNGPQVKFWNPQSRLVIDKKLPEFDDKGPEGIFTYPTNPHFKDGIFDITRFRLFQDDKNYYFKLNFRELVQPGWHPEYGFQLTFVAIAINQGTDQPGSVQVPRNANVSLEKEFAFHKILFIGGGIQLEDNKGIILLAYRPQYPQFALGNIQKKEISFTIPKKYLGIPSEKWKLAILVGGQDDHGGGGIGEFRNVSKDASGWQGGGGKLESGNNNVYDFNLMDLSNR